MKVDRLMTEQVQTLSPDKRLYHASTLMEEHGIRHIPVTDSEGRLLGIISDRDVKRHINSGFDTERETESDRLNMLVTVAELMATDVVVCTRETEARAAARLLLTRHVSALPVVDPQTRELQGIVSTSDFLAHFLDLGL
ncbi:MAG: CBS domain-containing protein [Myxococcota bacterium]|nr:CBS domain-containing protein [Myxococcota bacterium]MEE2780477.1 CBS domain-containing protein [Myxococcota bacterium]